MTVTGPPDDYTDHLKTAAHEALSITDIGERLRGIAVPITHQAADEIERLRALAAELHDALEQVIIWYSSGFAPQSQAMALRKANEAMANYRALEPKT